MKTDELKHQKPGRIDTPRDSSKEDSAARKIQCS